MFLLGLSVSIDKPNFDTFLTPLLIELKELEYGLKIKNYLGSDSIKCFTISGVYDKPARAALLFLVSCTGFFGCLKCLQAGETFKTEKGAYNFHEF